MGTEGDPRALPVPPIWAANIDDWTVALRAAGRSRQTIATRTDHLRRLARALDGNPWRVSAAQLEAWAGAQSWAPDTRRSVYASVRGFYSWGTSRGRVEISPAVTLPSVRPSEPSPHPAPDDVLAFALVGADARLRLILRLAAEAGLRRAEIAQVHARDLERDLLGWSLRVHGKGGRVRTVPLTASLSDELRLAVRAGGGWALPGDDGGHLSPRYVGKLGAAALPEGWTLHSLRHRFATRVYAASGDLLAVQRLLGHASPSTTQRYVRVDDDALRRAVAAAA